MPRLSIAFAPSDVSSDFKSYYSSNYYTYPLATAYGPYSNKIYNSGNITASLDVILSRRIAVTLDIGATFVWKDMLNGYTDEFVERKSGAALSFIPQFKLYYMNRPVVRLYGDIGIGALK